MPTLRSLAAGALLAVLAAAHGAAQSAPPAPSPSAGKERHTRAFQILLLVAELEGSPDLVGIPKNALGALKDIQDFLPYKSYRLLDAAFVRSSFSTRAVLAGSAGQSYEVKFVVRDAPNAVGKRLHIDDFSVFEAHFTALERIVATPQAQIAPVTPRPPAVLLSTSFDMAVGETVVVGTSKLDGPTKAMVVVLSSIP